MTFDDRDIPGWARPLTRGPIYVDEQTDADELSRALGERLEALLQLYGCDASPEGWRSLALRLALDHEIVPGKQVMQVITPADRKAQIGGAEPGRRWWLAMRLKKRAKKLGSMKAAAKELVKSAGRPVTREGRPLTIGRIENIAADAAAGRLAKPREMERLPWEGWIKVVLHKAADRLETGHDSKRLFS